MPTQDKLTFLEDKVILIISAFGLLLVTAAVLWVVRQSPDWRAINRLEEEYDGAEGLLGGRTRVVAGGREALKEARKQAKKRAKTEFRESSAGQKRRNRVQQHEKKRPTTLEESLAGQQRTEEATRSAHALQRLESYILNHKVSSLEALEAELNMPSPEIAARIEELESRGVFTGIMIDDARDRDGGTKKSSFVRVSDGEMRALAAFINERGRLTVTEVAVEANRVLQLLDGRDEIYETASRQHSECPEEDAPAYEDKMGIEAPSDRLQHGAAERTLESSTTYRISGGGTNTVAETSVDAR